MYRPSDRDKVVDEFRSLHEQQPHDATRSYLYGLTLVGRRSGEAITLFDAALADSPAFAWPHLELSRIHATPVFENQKARVSHLSAFFAACPNLPGPYGDLISLNDKAFVATHAAKLRTLVEGIGAGAVGAYVKLPDTFEETFKECFEKEVGEKYTNPLTSAVSAFTSL
jgi:hypothetical protein